MKEYTEQTHRQIARALSKVAAKFPLPADSESLPLTDICLQVKQESGELLIFDDDDVELTRCVIEEWLDDKSETFYEDIQPLLRRVIADNADVTEHYHLLKPYTFFLAGGDADNGRETIADLYLVDDDTLIIGGELMPGLSGDLERFWEELSRQ